MKIDFHTHGKLAKKLPFSRAYTQWLLDEAMLVGLDAICLTEHFNTTEFLILYHYIRSEFTQTGDCFQYRHLKIFPGMEVDVKEGGHVTVIGTMSDILSCYHELDGHMLKDHFLSFRELLVMLKKYPVIIGAAHPFRSSGHLPELSEDLLRQLSFVELNGKDVAADREMVEKQTYALAGALNLPVIAGSDTHQSVQFGSVFNQMHEACLTVEHLRQLMKEGAYRIEVSGHCKMQVHAAGMLKRALKEIHVLGGDYAAVSCGK